MNWRKLMIAGAIGVLITGMMGTAVVLAYPGQAAGLFQLDASLDGTAANPAAKAAVTDAASSGDDWDRIAADFGKATNGATTSSAESSSFDSETNADGTANAQTIFTGGGSKDQQPLSAWASKDQLGGLPDKDNLLHAMAARYSSSVPNSYIYFGADRYDNSGDAQIGFWFFKNPVCVKADGSFGNTLTGTVCSGTAVHTAGVVPHNTSDSTKQGDILILSDFTQGGTQPTIRIFEWVGTGGSDGSVNLIGGGAAQNRDCSAVVTDDFCASVNNFDGAVAPWLFKNKSGQTSFGHGEFYEGGLNLNTLGLQDECFSSFLAETRSSQSVTATLKDFVLGGFEACTSGITTTPSSSSIHLGQSVTDGAVVTGAGSGTPTGAVVFHVCNAGQLDANGQCSTGGALVGSASGVTLTPDANDPKKANATSDSYTPAAPGHYCFRGDYVPATGSKYAAASDFATTECFDVTQSSVVTTPSSTSFTLGTGTGHTVTDGAVVTGLGGGTPTGAVVFHVCTSAELDANGKCSAGGSLVGSASGVALIADANDATKAKATSDAYTPSAAGHYCFRGDYVPATGSPYAAAADFATTECFDVTSSSVVTTPSSTSFIIGSQTVTDGAVVTGLGGGTPTGAVVFHVCTSAELDANGKCSAGGSLVGSASGVTLVADANDVTKANATSAEYTPPAIGHYCFRGDYVPATGSPYAAASDFATTECFDVTDIASTTTAQKWLPNDTATVTSAGGTTIAGTVTFSLYENGACTGTAAATFGPITVVSGVAISNNTSYYTTTKTISWRAVFTSSNAVASGSSSHCETMTVGTLNNDTGS